MGAGRKFQNWGEGVNIFRMSLGVQLWRYFLLGVGQYPIAPHEFLRTHFIYPAVLVSF